MENASKALIIAGAILLSILIIAIGMYIYNSSQQSIQGAAAQIGEQDIQAFNQTWEMYEGAQTGANIKTLISKLSTNYNTNKNEPTKLPTIWYPQTSATTTYCSANCVADFNSARAEIQARHTYYVTLIQNDSTSLVETIIVTWNEMSYTEAKAAIAGGAGGGGGAGT